MFGVILFEIEFYEDIVDEKKFIVDVLGEVEFVVEDFVENEECVDELLFVLLLLVFEEEKGDYENEWKKGKVSGFF